MNKNKRIGLVFAAVAPLFAMLLLGCGPKPASNRSTIPRDNVTQCVSLCGSAGLELQSLVIVANQTGCVCSPPNVQSSAGSAAAASGGAVAVLIAQQQQQQQQR
jgi:hypothetical protein